MPNWTTNTLLMTGSDESISRVRAAFGPDDNNLAGRNFDFNALLPMPAELNGIVAPPQIVKTKVEADRINTEWNTQRDRSGTETETRAITRAHADELMARHGATDWYDWNNRNWGTKWNGSQLEVIVDQPRALVVRFDTAWCAPQALLEHLHRELGMNIIGGAIHEDGDEFELIGLFDTTALPANLSYAQAAQLVFDKVFTLCEEVHVEDSDTDDTDDTWSWTQRWIELNDVDNPEELSPPTRTLDN